MKKFVTILILCYYLMSCSRPVDTAGGVTSTGNTISGIIKHESVPKSGVNVTLYPEDYNPINGELPDSLHEVTNNDGKYFFKVSNPGKYTVFAQYPEEKTVALIQGIEIFNNVDTNITVQEAYLQKPATIILYINELPLEDQGYVYIPGTGVNIAINNDNKDSSFVTLTGVPPANYTSINYIGPMDSIGLNFLGEDMNVKQGDTIVKGPYETWTHSAKVIINTGATGANTINDINNYPLLIRLHDSNFTFDEALPSGEDVRFVNNNNDKLFYEIERWDNVSKLAEIWVKVDKIIGNNSTQYITMYWGKEGAGDQSMGDKIFEVDNNFLGVWHLNENIAGDTVDVVKDRTQLMNHGTVSGYSGSNNLTTGIVGNSFQFDGYDDIISIPNFTVTNTFTVSAWAKSDSLDPSWNHIVGRHPSWYLGADSSHGRIVRFSVNFVDVEIPFDSVKNIDVMNWNLYTGVYDGQTVQTYLNGELKNSISYSDSIRLEGNTCIGGYCSDPPGVNNPYWYGDIDEVRVSGINRSADWIKLNFENQKTGSMVVMIIREN